jgi:hypothetical protein
VRYNSKTKETLMGKTTGPIDGNRNWVRGDNGELDGSVTVSSPQPNVDLPDYLPGDTGVRGSSAARTAVLGAAALGTLLAGGAVLANPAVAATPTVAPVSIKAGGAATFAKTIAMKKTKACLRAKKAVKRAKSPAAKAKAKKRVAKRCAIKPVIPPEPGVLPAGGVGYNPDGSVRMGPEFWNPINGAPGYDIPKTPAQFQAAIDGVSGVNWRPQPNQDPRFRVGWKPDVPAQLIENAKLSRGSKSMMAATQLVPGDDMSGAAGLGIIVLAAPVYEIAYGTVAIRTLIMDPVEGEIIEIRFIRSNGWAGSTLQDPRYDYAINPQGTINKITNGSVVHVIHGWSP